MYLFDFRFRIVYIFAIVFFFNTRIYSFITLSTLLYEYLVSKYILMN